MKKLLETFSTISSLDLSNVTTDNDNTKYDTVSNALVKDINTAAKNAGLKVTITTAKSGHSEMTKTGNKSRHSTGEAVDISIINGKKITKDLGDKLVDELKKLGYEHSESESGKSKVILWQVQGHYNHIHVSNTSDVESSEANDDEINTDSDSETESKKYVTKILSKMFGLNENKQIKIINNIDRIKKLL